MQVKDEKEGNTAAVAVKKEEKLSAADSESMDACMELLYGGGEGGAGDAEASSADTAQEGVQLHGIVISSFFFLFLFFLKREVDSSGQCCL